MSSDEELREIAAAVVRALVGRGGHETLPDPLPPGFTLDRVKELLLLLDVLRDTANPDYLNEQLSP